MSPDTAGEGLSGTGGGETDSSFSEASFIFFCLGAVDFLGSSDSDFWDWAWACSFSFFIRTAAAQPPRRFSAWLGSSEDGVGSGLDAAACGGAEERLGKFDVFSDGAGGRGGLFAFFPFFLFCDERNEPGSGATS